MARMITDDEVTHWREHGYVIVEGFLDDHELRGGRDDMYRIFPTAEQYAAEPSAYPTIEGRKAQGNEEFPYADGPTLNRNTTVPELLSFVERALGTDDILLTQSLVWSKYGRGGEAHDQALHFDYVDNSLVVPADDVSLDQIPMILYYEDVTVDLGPTYVLSRRYYETMPLVDNRSENPLMWSFRAKPEHPALYDDEVAVTVPAGSLMAFAMDTLHRGSAFHSPSGGRFTQHLVFRNAACNWMGWRSWPRFAWMPAFIRYVEEATVRERTVIGFPPPGHRYWTARTIREVNARYPRMDMAPYVDAADPLVDGVEQPPPAYAGFAASTDSE